MCSRVTPVIQICAGILFAAHSFVWSENWILADSAVMKLEALQGELVKMMLKWPSNTVACAGGSIHEM